MKKIPLAGKYGAGKFTLVDDDVYEWAYEHSWYVTQYGYVVRTIRKKDAVRMENGKKKPTRLTLHICIMGRKNGCVNDHINRDKLDNRRENLRHCTQAENAKNRSLPVTNTSGFKGVSLERTTGKWKAQIVHNGKNYYLGIFDTPEEASILTVSRRVGTSILWPSESGRYRHPSTG